MKWGTLTIPRVAKVRENARFAARSRRFDGGNRAAPRGSVSVQPGNHSVAPPLASLGASEQRNMPRYTDSAGHEVAPSLALNNVGKLRPGFHQVLEAGESAHFSIMTRDAAPPNGMFFHDENDPEKAFAAQQARLSDQRRAAWQSPATHTNLADATVRTATTDAEADFAEVQRKLSERRRNAWKGA